MVDLYHGSPNSFDEFDQGKIRARDSSQIQYGRGHYMVVGDQSHAGRWITGNPRHGGVIMRFSVDDAVLNDPKRFISHTREFHTSHIDYMAARAEEVGYKYVADNLRHLSDTKGDKVTGADLANMTKYDVNAAHYLRHEGFLGFTHESNTGSGTMVKNAIFLNAGDIPAATPMVTFQYIDEVVKKGQQVPASQVPTALAQETEAYLGRVEKKGKELGLSPDDINSVKERVSALSRGASDVKTYDGKTQMHPLKLTDAALVLKKDGCYDRRLADAMRLDTEQFVHDGMKSLGHQPRPQVLTERLAESNRYALGYIQKGEYGYKGPQLGRATLPGMAASAGVAVLVAGGMAMNGAPVDEITREVKEHLTPQVVNHAINGETKEMISELAAGTVSTAVGAALGGASAGLICGPAAPVCSTVGAVGGAVIGGLGLHETAKKGFLSAISLVSSFIKEAPGTPRQIAEQQKSLLDRTSLSSMEKDGKKLDVAGILRDPGQRDNFIKQLDMSAQAATNPDVKDNFSMMARASRDFVALEDKRKEMLGTTPPSPFAEQVVPAQDLATRSDAAIPLMRTSKI